MDRTWCKCTWAAVSLVAIWALASNGEAKPGAPKPAATDQNATAPAPAPAVQPAKADGRITAVNPPATPAVLENPATFTPDMSFGRAIEILRRCTNPPVGIVVLWRNLQEKANITKQTPIGIDGTPGLSVRRYLELLLRSVSAGSDAEVSYALDGGVVVIATKDMLPKPKIETRVYDISDLAAPPSTGILMFPVTSPLGNSMQSNGSYGTGTQTNRSTSRTGSNRTNSGTFNGYSSTNQAQRPSYGGVMVGGR
jgi:hypothetical protein